MSSPKTKPRTYAPVPYEANPAKRLAWQTAYLAKRRQQVAASAAPCQCPEVGYPCPACVTYAQTHYQATWETRLAADQRRDQGMRAPACPTADREQELADKRAYWHANKEKYLGRYPYPGTLPPGQYVGHCGVMQRITELPHVCVRCGVRLFKQEDLNHG